MVPAPFRWVGGKARLARQYATICAQHIPRGGTFYEGFGGVASVSAVLGHLRPDIHILITETDHRVIRGLRFIQAYESSQVIEQVTDAILKLIHDEFREFTIQEWCDSADPVLWLAGMNCRYAGDQKNNNWNPDDATIYSRLGTIKKAFPYWRQGLARAQLLCQSVGVCSKADVAFFDPPYTGNKNWYPHTQGNLGSYLQVYRTQQQHSDFILITDFDTAKQYYEPYGFVMKLANEDLLWESQNGMDAYYTWTIPEESERSGSQ